MALAKQAKGEKLTSEEKAALRSTVKLQSYAEWLKSREPVLFEKFGDNEQAYKDYFDDNRDYFYGGDKVIYWMVDEDVKSWGIPNNDIRLLDKAIGCWERERKWIRPNGYLPVIRCVVSLHRRNGAIGTKPIKTGYFLPNPAVGFYGKYEGFECAGK